MARRDQNLSNTVAATFKSLDRNRDNELSKVEAKADDSIWAAFDTVKVNLNGYITKAEYMAHLERSYRSRERKVLITGAAAVVIATVIASAVANSLDASSLQKQFLGSWRLITWEERDSSNAIHYPLGSDAVGQISYTNDGRMSAQLMRRATALRQRRLAAGDGAGEGRRMGK